MNRDLIAALCASLSANAMERIDRTAHRMEQELHLRPNQRDVVAYELARLFHDTVLETAELVIEAAEPYQDHQGPS